MEQIEEKKEKMMLWDAIQEKAVSFYEASKNTSEAVYLVLLSVYVCLFLELRIYWLEPMDNTMYSVRYFLLSIVMWGAALYLISFLANWLKLWKKTPWLLLISACRLGAGGWFSTKMTTNSYTVVMDVFFCLMACGKNYKRMLRCVMFVVFGMLLFAGVGVIAGFAGDLVKPENASPGHSFGINYPNTWGYICFLGLMILWYLYLRRKTLITFGVFWAVMAFMYFVISCRTIAVLTAVFPLLAWGVDALEQRAKAKLTDKKPKTRKIDWIITVIPFLVLAFMLFASMNYVWVHENLYYTALHTFAMRFVQGGLYFKTYGFPVFGNPYRSNVYTYVNVNGEFEKVGILDSSFAAYFIMRGCVWMAYTLGWLCLANWKAMKKRDYAIPFLGAIILVFAMMERPGLDLWYNFILLYPLAAVGAPEKLNWKFWEKKKKQEPAADALPEQSDGTEPEKTLENITVPTDEQPPEQGEAEAAPSA